MQFMLALLCFFGLFTGYHSLKCMSYGNMEDIDHEKLKGQWWEYQTYNTRNFLTPDDHDCLVAKFYPNPNGCRITIIEDYIKRVPGRVNEEHTRREWLINRPTNSNAATYYGYAPTETGSLDYPRFTYNVVDTDYDNWLIAAVCSYDHYFQATYAMTRSQTPTASQVEMIESKIKEINKLNEDKGNWSIRFSYTTKKNDKCQQVEFPKEL